MKENHTTNQKPEELLYEVAQSLPEAEKLILLGVARGMVLSTSVPRAG